MTALRLQWTCWALVTLASSGCMSFTTMQTPRTVPRGQTRIGANVSALGVGYSSSAGVGVSGGVAVLPTIEGSVRYGISDDVDFGAKLYLLGAEVGLKWQFLRGTFDAAIAPAIGGSGYSFSSGTTSETVGLLQFHLPILFGANISDNVTFAFGPKLLFNVGFGTASASGSTYAGSQGGMWGGLFIGLPIRIADDVWIAPEFNIYSNFFFTEGTSTAFDRVAFEGGLAFFFGGGVQRPPPQQPPPYYGPPPGQPGQPYYAPPPGQQYAPPPGQQYAPPPGQQYAPPPGYGPQPQPQGQPTTAPVTSPPPQGQPTTAPVTSPPPPPPQ